MGSAERRGSVRTWAGPSLLALLASGGCGGDAAPTPQPEPAADEIPIVAEVPRPKPRVKLLSEVELLSESVTNTLGALGEKLFVRDFDGIEGFLTEDFVGHDPFTPKGEGEPLPLSALSLHYDVESLEILEKGPWLAALEARIGTWRRLEQSTWKVMGAEFQKSTPLSWGRLEVGAHLVGVTQAGGREVIELAGVARVRRAKKGWRLSQLWIRELHGLRSSGVGFQDVSRAAGVHHEGIRFGREGNDSDGWNGAATGDFNGDGRLDLALPGSLRNFLYIAQPKGGYKEVAQAAGFASVGGGTGVVAFDYDNDGDTDLAVAHIGWQEWREGEKGSPTRIFRGDGKGNFEDVTSMLGLAERRDVAFSATVLDYDGDGWLDLYLCCYGRMESVRNDSWVESRNGSPDVLLRNAGGTGFVDVTEAAGLADKRWSYTAVAVDYDSDGDPDLYVGNNFGSNRLWQNQGDGTFKDVATSLGVGARGNTMGVTWGDVNGDGRLDLFLSNPSSTTGKRILARFQDDDRPRGFDDLLKLASGNRLFLAEADGGFKESPKALGASGAGWAWGTCLADFDEDGSLDLVCANGFVTGDLPQDT